MKILLKAEGISYEKHNEILVKNPMKAHWTTNEISIESSKD